MTPDYAHKAIRGLTHPVQEDSCGFSEFELGHGLAGNPRGVLAVLADGMGGEGGGDVASAAVLEAFTEKFMGGDGLKPARFKDALDRGNEAITTLKETRQDLPKHMGTTLVGAAIAPDGLRWISVGDSPLYLCRDGKVEQVNEDHSLGHKAKQAAAQGKISEEDARNFPNRNVLESAVMGREIKLTDLVTAPLALRDGDVVIAASDGLETLTTAQIASVVSAEQDKGAGKIAEALISSVQAAGDPEQDDTTVLVVKIPPGYAAPAPVAGAGPNKWLLAALGLLVLLGAAAAAVWHYTSAPAPVAEQPAQPQSTPPPADAPSPQPAQPSPQTTPQTPPRVPSQTTPEQTRPQPAPEQAPQDQAPPPEDTPAAPQTPQETPGQAPETPAPRAPDGADDRARDAAPATPAAPADRAAPPPGDARDRARDSARDGARDAAPDAASPAPSDQPAQPPGAAKPKPKMPDAKPGPLDQEGLDDRLERLNGQPDN